MRATNIRWDADGRDPEELGLPSEMPVPQNIRKEDVADWLSDQSGWLVEGFMLEPDEHIRLRKVDAGILPDDVTWRVGYLENPTDLADVCFALYGEAPMSRIQAMQGAEYPCWALFSKDEDAWGRCEGPVPAVLAKLGGSLNSACRKEG